MGDRGAALCRTGQVRKRAWVGPALGEVPLPDVSQLPQHILTLEAREEVRMSVKGRWQRQGSHTIQSQGLCDVLTIYSWCASV